MLLCTILFPILAGIAVSSVSMERERRRRVYAVVLAAADLLALASLLWGAPLRLFPLAEGIDLYFVLDGVGRYFLCAVLLLIGLCAVPAWKTLLAWLLFTEHMLMLAALQALLIALFQNALAGEVTVLFVQLVSLFFSVRLPGSLALLLPGNWGMLARSAEFEAPQRFAELHGGFPLWTAFALNAAVLLLIVIFGWRLVRRKTP